VKKNVTKKQKNITWSKIRKVK